MKSIKESPILGFVMLFISMVLSLLATEVTHGMNAVKLWPHATHLKPKVANSQTAPTATAAPALMMTAGEPSVNLAAVKRVTKIAKIARLRHRRIHRYHRYRHHKRKHHRHLRHRVRTHVRRLRTHAIRVSRGAPRSHPYEAAIKAAGSAYWPSPEQLDALVWISAHESTRCGIISSAGYEGLFQLGNPPRWMVLGDPASETRAGCEYIKGRYGTPLRAKAWKLVHGWY